MPRRIHSGEDAGAGFGVEVEARRPGPPTLRSYLLGTGRCKIYVGGTWPQAFGPHA